MSRKNAGIVIALCLFTAGSVGADRGDDRDDDDAKGCMSDWADSCSRECATARCVANCAAQARDKCKVNVTNPQVVFVGPVTSTPTNQCVPPDGTPACTAPSNRDDTNATAASCSTLTGRVANRNFWGGNVTIYVICPAGSPTPNSPATTTVIGTATSSCTNGRFTTTVTNACSGQTGCYGLIAATPPSSCETCGSCKAPTGDPGWGTCTAGPCPSP